MLSLIFRKKKREEESKLRNCTSLRFSNSYTCAVELLLRFFEPLDIKSIYNLYSSFIFGKKRETKSREFHDLCYEDCKQKQNQRKS